MSKSKRLTALAIVFAMLAGLLPELTFEARAADTILTNSMVSLSNGTYILNSNGATWSNAIYKIPSGVIATIEVQGNTTLLNNSDAPIQILEGGTLFLRIKQNTQLNVTGGWDSGGNSTAGVYLPIGASLYVDGEDRDSSILNASARDANVNQRAGGAGIGTHGASNDGGLKNTISAGFLQIEKSVSVVANGGMGNGGGSGAGIGSGGTDNGASTGNGCTLIAYGKIQATGGGKASPGEVGGAGIGAGGVINGAPGSGGTIYAMNGSEIDAIGGSTDFQGGAGAGIGGSSAYNTGSSGAGGFLYVQSGAVVRATGGNSLASASVPGLGVGSGSGSATVQANIGSAPIIVLENGGTLVAQNGTGYNANLLPGTAIGTGATLGISSVAKEIDKFSIIAPLMQNTVIRQSKVYTMFEPGVSDHKKYTMSDTYKIFVDGVPCETELHGNIAIADISQFVYGRSYAIQLGQLVNNTDQIVYKRSEALNLSYTDDFDFDISTSPLSITGNLETYYVTGKPI